MPQMASIEREIEDGGPGMIAVALVILGLSAGCHSGSLEPAPDTRPNPGDASLDLAGRFVQTDLDVRSPDGAHACGFFPDTCPDGANCFALTIDGERTRRCLKYESGAVGDDCPPRNPGVCGDGRRCVRNTCRSICDPDRPGEFGCGSDQVCVAVRTDQGRLPWGICEERADKCTLWPNDDCEKGKNCYALKQGNRCRSYDSNAEIGDRCTRSRDCNDGQVCVRRRGAGSSEAVCREKCDENHPCSRGTCGSISDLAYGACFPRSDAG